MSTDRLSDARQVIALFEANDVAGFDAWRADEEAPGNWSLTHWLTSWWFPQLDSLAGPNRHLGHGWLITDRIVRYAIVGDLGQLFATIRFGDDGMVDGLVLGEREKEEGDPPGGIYLSSPPDRWLELMDFYAKLFPPLSFGLALDGNSDYVPPRWPDPQYPQQLHLDILVPDLGAGEEIALAHGGTKLQDKESYRTYADPIGHPFCLYRDTSERTWPSNALGVLGRIVLDCPDPEPMATFYGQLLRMPERVEESPERIVITRDADTLPMFAFQRVENHQPPVYHDPARPQQLHFDLRFDDRAAAEARVVQLGGTKLPPPGFPHVYADPAGHPFCILEPGD